MSAGKKAARIGIIIGLIMILGSVLVIVMTAKTDHYSATVTEITKTYRTRASGNSTKKYYNEDVSVTFINSEGQKIQAQGVRIKRTTEQKLPEVGETIEVTSGLTGVKEYRVLMVYAAAGTVTVVGILMIFFTVRVSRRAKKKRAEAQQPEPESIPEPMPEQAPEPEPEQISEPERVPEPEPEQVPEPQPPLEE